MGVQLIFVQRYVFMLLTMLKPELSVEWHYNKAHHGKGPMDGEGGAVKKMAYRRVIAGDVVIDNPKNLQALQTRYPMLTRCFCRMNPLCKSQSK